MLQFFGLHSKLYAFKVVSSDDMNLKGKLLNEGYDEDENNEVIRKSILTKKAKGVSKSIIKTQITFENCVMC